MKPVIQNNKRTNFNEEGVEKNRRECCYRRNPKPEKNKERKPQTFKEQKEIKVKEPQAGKRCLILSKIFGENPEHYIQFEEEYRELKMGQLIKKYAEVNEITNQKIKKESFKNKSERRTKVLAKVYGGEPSQFEKFEEENKDLRIGKLIKKYAEVNEINTENVEKLKNKKVKGEKFKVEKLARFFSKPEEDYSEFVKEHPNLCFKRLLKEMGVQVTREQIQEFRKTEKERRRERKEGRKEKKQRKSGSEKKKREFSQKKAQKNSKKTTQKNHRTKQ